MRLDKIIQELRRPGCVLAALILFKAYQVMEAFRSPRPFTHSTTATILIIEAIVCAALLVPVIKGNKIALLAVGLYLWAHAVGSIPLILFAPMRQYVLKIVAAALGIYFGWGGTTLIQRARGKDRGGAEP